MANKPINWIVLTNDLGAKYPFYPNKDYSIEIVPPSSEAHQNMSEAYRDIHKVGMDVYIVRNCSDPRRYRKQDWVCRLDESILPFDLFPHLSDERRDTWEKIRRVALHVIGEIIHAPKLGINYDYDKRDRWCVVDLTVQTVCDKCFRIVDKEKIISTETNKHEGYQERICSTCLERLNESNQSNSSHKGNVYFFLEEPSGNIKIGSSNDVEKRKEALQVGNSKRLITVHQIPSNDCNATERAFHSHFKDKRIFHKDDKRSEWFVLTEADIEWIKKGDYPTKIQKTIDSHIHVVEDNRKSVEEFHRYLLENTIYSKTSKNK